MKTAVPALILAGTSLAGCALAGEPRSICVFALLPALLWAVTLFRKSFDPAKERDWCALILLCGLYFLRMLALPLAFGDYKGFLLPWYEQFQQQSFAGSMQKPVTNYMVLYEYFIYLISRTRYVPLELYKLFSLCFEALLGLACGELAFLAGEKS